MKTGYAKRKFCISCFFTFLKTGLIELTKERKSLFEHFLHQIHGLTETVRFSLSGRTKTAAQSLSSPRRGKTQKFIFTTFLLRARIRSLPALNCCARAKPLLRRIQNSPTRGERKASNGIPLSRRCRFRSVSPRVLHNRIRVC